MNKQFLTVLVVAILAATGGEALGAPGYIQLAAPPRQLGVDDDFPGMWEYVYDVYGNSTPYIVDTGLYGFDASLIVNQWTYTYSPITGTLVQNWDWNAANGGGGGGVGSQSFDGTTWTPVASDWGIDNPWHTPDEYVKGANSMALPAWFCPGVVSGDSIMYTAKFAAGNRLTGLTKTFRIVHPYEPGTINWWVESAYGPEEDGNGTVTGPVASPVPGAGDVNADFDVDADDIDLMAEYIRTGLIPAGAAPGVDFDLSDNGTTPGPGGGTVTILDMDYLIRFLAETSAVDGLGDPIEGTQYGDFNLDGLVNTTDLTILATNFGPNVNWALGNANGNSDEVINNTDLTIMATYFNFTNGGVDNIPEPMTIGLLSFGAIGLLRRRRPKARRGGQAIDIPE